MTATLRYLPESNALTQGIRIVVKSSYLPEQSSPAERRYVFSYTVRIINEGEVSARLRSRHWVITDAHGGVEEVRGPGVVGKHPSLAPGESFEYRSGCVLKTSRGTMRGSYQMERNDGTSFDAEIATFALTLPPTLN